ncbi:hypothetical protein M3Y99_00056800 [Aphelenchoides fujianensis]|nr:hypothetical protein M3Y99_00056800 [Aphelenchoides fujianensis]
MLPTIAANNQIAAFRSDPQPPKPPAATPPPPEVVQPTLVSLPQSFDFQPARSSKSLRSGDPDQPDDPAASRQSGVRPAAECSTGARSRLLPTPTPSSNSRLHRRRVSSKVILYPMIESAANQIAHYLSAGQGPVPMPYLQAAEVRTSYPANYPASDAAPTQQRKQMSKE